MPIECDICKTCKRECNIHIAVDDRSCHSDNTHIAIQRLVLREGVFISAVTIVVLLLGIYFLR